MAFTPRTVDMKRGDTGPPLTDVIEADDDPVDLTGCSVTILCKTSPTATVLKFSGVCTVDPDQVNHKGAITYQWGVNDCDTVGRYVFEYEIVTGTGRRETCPNGAAEYHVLLVSQDLS